MNHFSCLETGYKGTKNLDEFTLFSSSAAKTGHILKTLQLSPAQRKQLLYGNSCPDFMEGVHHSPLSCQDCTSILLLSVWTNNLSCKYFLSSFKSLILKKCVRSEGCCLFSQSSLFTITLKIFPSLQLRHISSYLYHYLLLGFAPPQLFMSQFSPNYYPGHYHSTR